VTNVSARKFPPQFFTITACNQKPFIPFKARKSLRVPLVLNAPLISTTVQALFVPVEEIHFHLFEHLPSAHTKSTQKAANHDDFHTGAVRLSRPASADPTRSPKHKRSNVRACVRRKHHTEK
jgi:hypothetical protein